MYIYICHTTAPSYPVAVKVKKGGNIKEALAAVTAAWRVPAAAGEVTGEIAIKPTLRVLRPLPPYPPTLATAPPLGPCPGNLLLLLLLLMDKQAEQRRRTHTRVHTHTHTCGLEYKSHTRAAAHPHTHAGAH